MKPIIQVQNLSKVYTMGDLKTVALDSVSFEIKQGEFVAIMGPSGSGKSTLMHILGALDKPTSGQYFLDGHNVGELDNDQLAEIRNLKIGFIFQAYNLLPRTSALKNVVLPMVYADIEPKLRYQKAIELLTLVGLQDRLNFQPNQLSGGQQQRVAIARALTLDPAILLADEPTGNIASAQADEIISIFQKLNDKGHTVIIITHEPDIASYSKRIIHIKDGKISSDQPNKQIRLI